MIDIIEKLREYAQYAETRSERDTFEATINEITILRGQVEALDNERNMLWTEKLQTQGENTSLREDLTWFWAIVDKEGFANVPSNERDALRILSQKASESDALREENARLLKENSELLFRARALLWFLPPEITCGELRKARDKMFAATIREGGEDA